MMFTPLFEIGNVFITPGALALLEAEKISATPFLARHIIGDWGDVPPDDAKENALSVKEGFRILSSYMVRSDRIWVITEADRSSTTLLLPDEY